MNRCRYPAGQIAKMASALIREPFYIQDNKMQKLPGTISTRFPGVLLSQIFLFDRIKRFLKVEENIIDVLSTDRKTDGIRLDTLLCLLCLV